jgi:DNA-binding CsgD family transcriptional regulator/pimeloyl-ACP methyl ester carboxylesterase
MDAPPVQYVTTSDGYNLAYCDSGEGRPFVFLPMTTTNLHVYWTQETFVRPWWEGLAQRFRLVQYDGRGQGMSTRGLPNSLSCADLVVDLETVADHVRLDRFVLMGLQWSGHTAIRFALNHPERVEALVLASCPTSFVSWSLAMLQDLAVEDWDAYLRAMAGLAKSPEVSPAVQRLKQTVNQSDWQLLMKAALSSDIEPLLSRLRVPTMVLHPRDSLNLRPEESMRVAALIQGARLTLIDGVTPLGEHGPGIAAIESFLAHLEPVRNGRERTRPSAEVESQGLSPRELEVLRLVAAGRSNQQIANELVISLFTVNRHVSNIFAKTGAANRAEAASYATRQGLV